jgi:hypothetical protein
MSLLKELQYQEYQQSSSYVRKIYKDFLDAPSHSTDMVSRNNRLMVLQFLSMKLAAVNPGMDCTVNDFLCKQVGKVYWIVYWHTIQLLRVFW